MVLTWCWRGADVVLTRLQARSSKTAWCASECEDHPITAGVMRRMANLTGVPLVNMELLQLLRYQQGEQCVS